MTSLKKHLKFVIIFVVIISCSSYFFLSPSILIWNKVLPLDQISAGITPFKSPESKNKIFNEWLAPVISELRKKNKKKKKKHALKRNTNFIY